MWPLPPSPSRECATSQIAWNQRIAHDVCRPICRIFEGVLRSNESINLIFFLDFIKERFEYNIQTQNEIYISHSFQKKLPWNMHFRLNQRFKTVICTFTSKMGFGGVIYRSSSITWIVSFHFINKRRAYTMHTQRDFFIAYTIVNMRERNVFSRGWGIFKEILV